MKNVENFLEDAKKFYKIKEYQKSINSCNSALNIEPFNEDAASLKVKCLLTYLIEDENLESKIKEENKQRWIEAKELKNVYDEFMKILEANDTKDNLINILGEEENKQCLKIFNLLNDCDDPSDSNVIEKKEKELVSKINAKLDEIKKFAKEKSLWYAYGMIHRIFIKPTGQLEFSSFDVYESIPTMKFLIDEKYHSWKLNYKGIKSTYIKSDSYHINSNGDINRNPGYSHETTMIINTSINKEKYNYSLQELYDSLSAKIDDYCKRYEYGCRLKEKLNNFLKSGGLFDKPKRRKYICQYLGIDYYTSDIYFTEVGDFNTFYKIKSEDTPTSVNNNPSLEELEKYIDDYK